MVVLVKSLKGLLSLKPSVEGKFVLAIHLCFAELWEVYTELQRAEFADFSIAARSLTSKLVARHVENLKTLSFVGAIERFKFVILGRETASVAESR